MSARVRALVLVSAALGLSSACGGGGGVGPSAAGTYNLRLKVLATGQKTPYSGPASFNVAGGHTTIICWKDSTFTTQLASFVRDLPTTAAGNSFPVWNQATAANNPTKLDTVFVVTDVLTSPTATPFGGILTITGLTATTLDANFQYSDGTDDVKGTVSAVLR
jgi:hypothetical protein